MSEAMYSEKVDWPGSFHLVMGLPITVGVVGLFFLIQRDGWGWTLAIPITALASLGAVWWWCRFLTIQTGATGAAFGFGGLRRHVPRDRIVESAVEEYQVSRYMGWGYRFGWGRRDRAYSVAGHKRGIRLVFDDARGRRWSVFLSCSDPEAALRALEE